MIGEPELPRLLQAVYLIRCTGTTLRERDSLRPDFCRHQPINEIDRYCTEIGITCESPLVFVNWLLHYMLLLLIKS